MSSPFYQRKWAGDPHTEKKRLPPEEPSKLQPRKSPKEKKTIVTRSLFSIPSTGAMGLFIPRERYYWGRSYDCPYVEKPIDNYYMAAEHVIKRLKAYIVRDTKLDVYWLQSNVTQQPISPEFSSKENLINWVTYEGLTRKYLKLDSFTGYKGRVIWQFLTN
jgi:hypothetical protein